MSLKEYDKAIQLLWNAYKDLNKENEKLKELCDKYEEEHNTTFKEWQKDIQANKEAIENIREWRKDEGNYCDGCTPGWCDLLEELLNILEGNNESN